MSLPLLALAPAPLQISNPLEAIKIAQVTDLPEVVLLVGLKIIKPHLRMLYIYIFIYVCICLFMEKRSERSRLEHISISLLL